jgi:hypothetical protein
MMDDEDNGGGGGLSGFAGYMLGRAAAASDHRARQFWDAVNARRRGARAPYDADDVDSAIASWERTVTRRDATIAELQVQLKDASAAEAALRQHNAMLANDNELLREQIAKHERDIGLMQGGVAKLLAFHEEELSRLRSEIARLKGEG